MYLQNFKLNQQPFEPSPDPDFLFLSNFHERAKSYMESVWDFPDGMLEPTLGVRHRIIAEIRQFKPDLVLTHRPNDYQGK